MSVFTAVYSHKSDCKPLTNWAIIKKDIFSINFEFHGLNEMAFGGDI